MSKLQPDFMIYIHADAWAKFRYWVEMAGEDEIGALGLVDEIRTDDKIDALMISEIFLLEQTVNGCENTLEDKAVANLMIHLAKQEIDNFRLKCWIHSHAVMKTFWSSTDNECCSKLANGSYALSVVTNLQGDILARIDVYNPCHMILDKIPVQIYYPQTDDLREQLEAEFKAKVKKTPAPPIPKKKMMPVDDFESEEDLEAALNQGLINFHEYEMLSGRSILEDF
jgi:hypothetical protein